MVDLLLGQDFRGFGGYGPIDAADQVLAVSLASQPAGPLLLCFMVEGLFDGRPIILHIDVGLCHEGSFMPVPLINGVSRPAPFFEVGKGGCHGSFHLVPGVLLFVDLVADGNPGLFDVLDVVVWPMVDQGVESPDVMDDDLVTWVSILFGVLVIDDISQSPM